MVNCIKSLTVDATWEDLNLSRREEGSGRQIEGSEPVLSILEGMKNTEQANLSAKLLSWVHQPPKTSNVIACKLLKILLLLSLQAFETSLTWVWLQEVMVGWAYERQGSTWTNILNKEFSFASMCVYDCDCERYYARVNAHCSTKKNILGHC